MTDQDYTDGEGQICTQPPLVGEPVGADCPKCGHNQMLHSRSKPCIGCELLAAGGASHKPKRVPRDPNYGDPGWL